MTIEAARPATRTGQSHAAFSGERAVVVGGTPQAAQTAARLQASGAEVVVIAADICPDMVDLLIERRITWQRREVDESDLATASLLFGASDRLLRRPRPAPARHWP